MRKLTFMPAVNAKPFSQTASIAGPRLHVPKVCVAIQARSADEMLERAVAALADSRFLEFRLDTLHDPDAAMPLIKQFLAERRDVMVIATCRRKAFGGLFAGSLTEEFEILRSAAQVGCRIVDLEVESAEGAGPQALKTFRGSLAAAGASLLVSFHDFTRTAHLEVAVARIAAFTPDFVKVVSTANSLADNLAVLKLIEERSISTEFVGIAMGEGGLISRVLGPRAGAAFTFASFSGGAETAPGQVTAQSLRDLYRIHELDRATQIFGVAGNPIAHSLSPLMHNSAFRNQGINAVLLPLKVRALPDLLTVLRELPLAGLAITMPLKQDVLPHLGNPTADAVLPLTHRIGACNTLRMGADGKIMGFNTDVDGVVRPLEKRLKLKGARIAILGAGGAARAAVFGLVDQGAQVFVVNRTHATAVALAIEAKAQALSHQAFAAQHFDVLINSTPCGMTGSKQALPIAEDELNAGLVFDMVYNPLETPLLKLARQRGIPVVTGLEMFIQQGARQFEIWTGKPAPETEMLRVVELELRNRA
jgi:3-dehydroquinate dehydratase/shikimate dehydrogenase